MEGIVVHSKRYGEGGRIQVEVDTSRDGMSAWRRDFHEANDILSLFLAIASEETEKVRDFVTRTVSFGEARAVLSCKEMDFSKHGFEKLPPA